jgi:hypothetical protein
VSEIESRPNIRASIQSASMITISKDIEAKEGDTYEVQFEAISAMRKCRLHMQVSVDGRLAEDFGFCTDQQDMVYNVSSSGFQISEKEGKRVYRAFTFSEMPVTGKLSPKVNYSHAYSPHISSS